jgi:transcriptional regulator with XRE-family HTH domain
MNHVFRQLRQAIKASPISRYQIAKTLGIDQSVISRFMSGEIGLTVANVEKIADYLELRIVFQAKGKRATPKRGK